jgi:hypothetical protein
MIGLDPQNCLTAGYYNFQDSVRSSQQKGNGKSLHETHLYLGSRFSFANINGMYLGTKSISEKDSMNGIIMTQGREFLPHS